MDPDTVSGNIGHQFRDPGLLRRALTHRSYGADHNERLEYLGDSIVNCVIALELYERFPGLSEGELSRLRANLVNQQSLHGIAQQLRIGEYLLLGEGELKSGGAQRPSILADSVEAILGAVMLDGGFTAAQDVVRRLFAGSLAGINPNVSGKDAKTMLQEFTQGRGIALPVYTLLGTQGHAHAQTFQVQCAIDELKIRTEGQGASRRAAEQDAAGKACALVLRT
ncbi:MAG: ribonuclease III [Burkholderiales bacterium]|nr:ribonuclease III [Burkholderiales bacterium]